MRAAGTEGRLEDMQTFGRVLKELCREVKGMVAQYPHLSDLSITHDTSTPPAVTTTTSSSRRCGEKRKETANEKAAKKKKCEEDRDPAKAVEFCHATPEMKAKYTGEKKKRYLAWLEENAGATPSSPPYVGSGQLPFGRFLLRFDQGSGTT